MYLGIGKCNSSILQHPFLIIYWHIRSITWIRYPLVLWLTLGTDTSNQPHTCHTPTKYRLKHSPTRIGYPWVLTLLTSFGWSQRHLSPYQHLSFRRNSLKASLPPPLWRLNVVSGTKVFLLFNCLWKVSLLPKFTQSAQYFMYCFISLACSSTWNPLSQKPSV